MTAGWTRILAVWDCFGARHVLGTGICRGFLLSGSSQIRWMDIGGGMERGKSLCGRYWWNCDREMDWRQCIQ